MRTSSPITRRTRLLSGTGGRRSTQKERNAGSNTKKRGAIRSNGGMKCSMSSADVHVYQRGWRETNPYDASINRR
jgi:hypothetical protein